MHFYSWSSTSIWVRICAIASASSRNPGDKSNSCKSSIYTHKSLSGLAKLVDKPCFKALQRLHRNNQSAPSSLAGLYMITYTKTNFVDSKDRPAVKTIDFLLLDERNAVYFFILYAIDAIKKILSGLDESQDVAETMFSFLRFLLFYEWQLLT